MISPFTALLLLILLVVFSHSRTSSDAVDALALFVLAFFGVMMALAVVLGVAALLLIAMVCFAFMKIGKVTMRAARALKTAALKNGPRRIDR